MPCLVTRAGLAGMAAALLFTSSASAAALKPQDCTFSVVATASDTCASLAAAWNLSVGAFNVYNPSVGIDCASGLVAGETYCVEQNYGQGAMPTDPTSIPPTPTPTPTATKGDGSGGSGGGSSGASTTTADAVPTAPNGSPIPSPVQDGITPDCINFYKVASGDTCAKIVKKFGTFDLDTFYKWNPAVETDCSGLWLDTYVCTGTTKTPTKPPSATSATPTGSPAPSPTQDGLTDKCTRFYKTVKGDTCAKIVAKFGTFSLNDFYSWNPAVGTDCSGLWLDTYVCIGIPGTPTSRPAATPSPTPTGPSPVQDGIDPSCNDFYKVVKGDTCQKIVNAHKDKLSLADFYKWNPDVGTDCASLYKDYYVCIGVGKKRRAVKMQ